MPPEADWIEKKGAAPMTATAKTAVPTLLGPGVRVAGRRGSSDCDTGRGRRPARCTSSRHTAPPVHPDERAALRARPPFKSQAPSAPPASAMSRSRIPTPSRITMSPYS